MIGMVATRRGSDSRSDIPLGAQGFAETFRTPTEGIPEHVELRLNGFTSARARSRQPRRCTVLRLHRAARPWSWWCGPTMSITPMGTGGRGRACGAATAQPRQQPECAPARSRWKSRGDRRQGRSVTSVVTSTADALTSRPGRMAIITLLRPTGRTACWGSRRDGQGRARRALSRR